MSSKPVLPTSEIVDQLTTSFSTEGYDIAWDGTEVTYTLSYLPAAAGGSEATGWTPMSIAMQNTARESFDLWDDLIAIDLSESSRDANAGISLNYSSTTGGSTYASFPGANWGGTRAEVEVTDSDIWFADDWWTHDDDADFFNGGYGIITYIHEIGHALGLSHPGHYNGSGDFEADAEYHQDTRQYTVMSYFNAGENGETTDHVDGYAPRYASTPLLHDITALQSLYGADMTTRTGDTVYGFNGNTGRDAFTFSTSDDYIVSIWDAGGADTIDISGWSTDQTLDLTEGSFSSIGNLSNNLSIAFGAVIENVVGGAGDDVLAGNAVANRLEGGFGDDTVRGFAGDDHLEGEAGDDSLFGGDGNDFLVGGTGTDIFHGGEGRDTIHFDAFAQESTISLASGSGQGDIDLDGVLEQFFQVEQISFDDGLYVSGNGAVIAQLYDTAFGRGADRAGLSTWTDALDDGMALNTIASNFVSSAEFEARYGATSNEGFVTLLYENTLERQPNQIGYNNWVAELDGGLSRAEVLVGFSQSPEHIAKLESDQLGGMTWVGDSDAEAISRLYLSALERLPDDGGLLSWLDASRNGTALSEIADSFTNSIEFDARYGALDNEAYIERLYLNVLDRAPDTEGLANWSGALENGILDRGDVLLGFSNSNEYKTGTDSLWDDGIMFV